MQYCCSCHSNVYTLIKQMCMCNFDLSSDYEFFLCLNVKSYDALDYCQMMDLNSSFQRSIQETNDVEGTVLHSSDQYLFPGISLLRSVPFDGFSVVNYFLNAPFRMHSSDLHQIASPLSYQPAGSGDLLQGFPKGAHACLFEFSNLIQKLKLQLPNKMDAIRFFP